MTFNTSLQNAVRGFNRTIKTEPNLRWQLLATFMVVLLGLAVQLTRGEWMLLVIVCGLVLTLELINTAVEKTLDIVKPRFDDHVGLVKDIMAGAVLLVSAVALIVGILIFWPHLF